MEENKNVINISDIVKKLLAHKKLFLKVLSIVFVLSCALILCVPRYYTCDIKLAPEYDFASGSSLSSIASSFGIDLGENPTTDAISPTLYPDLMESTDFLVSLFDIQVKSLDGTIDTDYFTYLKKYQKRAFWEKWIGAIKKMFEPQDTMATNSKGEHRINSFHLTKKEFMIAKTISKTIKCNVNKKTDVITLSVKAQDPLICACLADSIRERLQKFITDYRTNKSRNDLKFYKQLANQAKADYVKARRRYAEYVDTHTDVILESYKSEIEDMENDMQLKYNTYSTLLTQLQAASAKVQERTPAFTTLQSATVPIKPAGPKRMIFVIGMMFVAFVVTSIYIYFRKKD